MLESVSGSYIMLLVGCLMGAPGFPDRCTLISGHLLEDLPGLDALRIPALHSTGCSRDGPESFHMLSSRDNREDWPK